MFAEHQCHDVQLISVLSDQARFNLLNDTNFIHNHLIESQNCESCWQPNHLLTRDEFHRFNYD